MQKCNKINVLIVGGGGREHALAWSVSQSPILNKLYITQKICGTEKIAKYVDIDCKKSISVSLFCKQNAIELVIIGPEQYLADGLSDVLTLEGINVFGPGKAGAQLESSKSFAKDVCRMNNIPTARYACFSDRNSAKDFVRNHSLPLVIKDNGLAQGKGVIICRTLEDADQAINKMLSDQSTLISQTIIIEEFLSGSELSFFAFFDGKTVLPLCSVQDHKTITYGDKSYNTGGMGAFSPPKIKNIDHLITMRIIYPTVNSLASMGIKFSGILFAGIMVTKNGPQLLEYNVRFGDPEIQSIVTRLKSDLLVLMLQTAKGKLQQEKVEFNNKSSVCIVMANRGYPLEYTKGSIIRDLDKVSNMKDIMVFHAGTKMQDGTVIANSGRVLNIVASADTLIEAQEKAYAAVKLIDWPEGVYVDKITSK